MRLLDDIIGKEILDNSATVIGKVKDIEVDTSTMQIESIIITKGNSSRFKSSTTEEIIPFEMVNKIGDKIILKDDTFEFLID